jgi:hypothetical protein
MSFLHVAARVMLSAPERAFLVIEVQGHPCEYEILDREVGHDFGLPIACREWDRAQCGNEPFPPEAKDKVRALGFAPAGPHLNAWRAYLSQDAIELAVLLERSFMGAYGLPVDL